MVVRQVRASTPKRARSCRCAGSIGRMRGRDGMLISRRHETEPPRATPGADSEGTSGWREFGPARQREQPAANESLEIRACAHVGADSIQRSSHFAFAKAHARERPKGFGSQVRRRRRDCSPVDRAVGVAKAQARGRRALDEHLPAMDSPVVGSTRRDEIVRLVATAFGARVNVVHIQKSSRAAAGEDAAPAIAAEHRAANSRRHVLRRAGCRRALGTHMDASDALRVVR